MARLSLSQSNAGRPPALSHADQLLVALQYWREYRIYFHIASDWNVSESTVCRIVQRVETALLDSRYFRLPGKKHLLQETERPDVIVIDVTETPIERPKTGQKAYYSGKKAPHAQMPNYGRPIHPSHYLSRVRLEFGKGRRHDFRLFKTSAIHLHPETESLQDSGYQGIERYHANSYVPIKRSSDGRLTRQEREYNRTLSQERIVIEHINRSLKIFRILSSRYRNRRRRYGLCCNLIAAIYNYELLGA